METPRRNLILSGWRVLCAPALVLASVILVGAGTVLALVLPQGLHAEALLRTPSGAWLLPYATWGLTDFFASDWFFLAVFLFAGSVAATIIDRQRTLRPDLSPHELPEGAPHRAELDAPFPERAVETAADVLSKSVGPPKAERVIQSHALLVYDDGGTGRAAPAVAFTGLVLLLASASMHAAGIDAVATSTHALIEVTEANTGTHGIFDMREGEVFNFFEGRDRFMVIGYDPDRLGLGPAVQLEKVNSEGRQDRFWAYANAPQDFDRRHRRDEVGIRLIRAERSPVPGHGILDSWFGALVLIGAALLILGVVLGEKSTGRIWLDADGRRLTLVGAPERPGDRRFQARFEAIVEELKARLAT